MLKRYWINQPSILQSHHKQHGLNVLTDKSGRDGYFCRCYFTDGDVVSQEINKMALCPGWVSEDDRKRGEQKMREEQSELFEEKKISFVYTNWKGETRKRVVAPIKIHFGANDYHKEPQWIMVAFDIERDGYPVREFAMKNVEGLLI